jgi:hypothetical protein
MGEKISIEQKNICLKYNTEFVESPNHFKVGISLNLKGQIQFPINGLRHQPEEDTTGWYIWAGEYSSNEDFFVPLHVEHLITWCPLIIKYLGLPPGYRFLIGENNYEDIWVDKNLI